MRLFNLLKNIIIAINNAKNQIKNIKNKYYYTSKSGVTGTTSTSFTVCSLNDIPEGTYLVLGFTAGSVGTTTIMNAAIGMGENCTKIAGGDGRTTGQAGGGCHTWAIVEVSGGVGSLRLATYKYYSGTIGYSGNLAAIRLI